NEPRGHGGSGSSDQVVRGQTAPVAGYRAIDDGGEHGAGAHDRSVGSQNPSRRHGRSPQPADEVHRHRRHLLPGSDSGQRAASQVDRYGTPRPIGPQSNYGPDSDTVTEATSAPRIRASTAPPYSSSLRGPMPAIADNSDS